MKVMRIKLLPLIVSILIPVGVGAIAGFATMNSMEIYSNIVKPPLSPPGVVFPIVWTILFILMGISAYLIYTSTSPNKKDALILYGVQLVFNFLWTIFFFNWHAYLFSFIWILILWILILAMVISFYRINKCAGILQIPYLLWVTFAAYLNFGIFLLN